VDFDERGAVLVAEHAERLLDLPRGQHAFEGLVDEHAVVDRCIGRGEPGSNRPRAREIDHDVADDREQPGTQRAERVVEAVSCSPGAHERFLHSLLRQASVAQGTHGEAIQLGAVRGIDGTDPVVGRQRGLVLH